MVTDPHTYSLIAKEVTDKDLYSFIEKNFKIVKTKGWFNSRQFYGWTPIKMNPYPRQQKDERKKPEEKKPEEKKPNGVSFTIGDYPSSNTYVLKNI